MKKFIICFDNETKEKLEYNNYTFINEFKIKDKIIYMFLNNGSSISFNKENIYYTDKMFY